MEGFKCRGCELTFDGVVMIDDVVHDKGCVFYEPHKTFEDRIVEVVVADIKNAGRSPKR